MTLPVARLVASSMAVMEDTAMRHSRTLALAGVIVTALVLQSALHGQAGRTAEAELRAAQYRAEVQGDWAGAIADYERLSKTTDRDVAARALVALGDAYEKTGVGDPKPVFDRVVRTFADQKDVAAVASRRLAALSRGGAQEMTARRVWTTDAFFTRDISADGSLAVGAKGRVDAENRRHQDLFLRNVTSGEVRLLIASAADGGPAPLGGPLQATFSPDGLQVAYVWGERTDRILAFDGRPSLRMIGTEPGASPSVVFTADDSVDLIAIGGWSPDGTAILCTLRHSSNGGSTLAWISVADGSVRPIRTFSGADDVLVSRVSHDGQWVAYVRSAPGTADRHIHIMRASDGGGDAGVVRWTGHSQEPAWAPDGSHLLFRSNRSGTQALYGVRLANGEAAGEPFVIRDMLNGQLLRIFPTGELYYADNGPRSNSIVVVVERTGAGANVVQAFSGAVPNISPDGRFVALAATDGVVVRSLDTGEERLYEHAGLGFGTGGQYLHNRWLPDSSGLIVWITQDGDGGRTGGSFYHLDRATGAFTWLVQRITPGQVLSRAGAVSSDGGTFFLLAADTTDGPYTRVVQYDLATRQVRSTVAITGDELPGAFSVVASPDDSTLAIEHEMPGDRLLHISTVSTSGGLVTHIVGSKTPPMPDRIGWTPDGHVLFGALDRGVWRVMRIRATGGTPVPDGIALDQLSGTVSIPAVEPGAGNLGGVSRDGSRLVFEAGSKLQYEVWALENVLGFLSTR